MKKPVTVTITGAAGNIGYALAFRVASGQMLGSDQPINLNLLEIPAASRGGSRRGDGVERLRLPDSEQSDCQQPMPAWASRTAISPCWSARGRADPAWSARICCWRTPRFFPRRARRWMRSASRDVRVLVVGNPANTNSLIAQRNAPSLPPRALHGDDPIGSQPRTGAAHGEERRAAGAGQKGHHLGKSLGDPVPRFASRHGRRQAGAGGGRCRAGSRTPSFRPCSSAARPSSRRAAPPPRRPRRRRRSTMSTIGCWARRPGDWVSMAVPSDGSYGIPEGVIYSYPVTCKNGEYSIVQGLSINDFSREKMQATHRELLEERDGVKDLI